MQKNTFLLFKKFQSWSWQGAILRGMFVVGLLSSGLVSGWTIVRRVECPDAVFHQFSFLRSSTTRVCCPIMCLFSFRNAINNGVQNLEILPTPFRRLYKYIFDEISHFIIRVAKLFCRYFMRFGLFGDAIRYDTMSCFIMRPKS